MWSPDADEAFANLAIDAGRQLLTSYSRMLHTRFKCYSRSSSGTREPRFDRMDDSQGIVFVFALDHLELGIWPITLYLRKLLRHQCGFIALGW